MRPTLLINVTNKMKVAQEEIFRPVAVVIKFHDVDEVIAIANDSIYGLGGAVFSKDINKALKVARRVETGRMWVNTYNAIIQMKNIMINLDEAPSGLYLKAY